VNPRFEAASRRRSERVLVQIRLIVETRLENAVQVTMDAFTLVVNAHGGILEISQKLPQGHRIFLVNTGTGARAACHVVSVRRSQEDGFAVAFEFEQPSPDFWPIHFPPRDWQMVGAK
jgi:hypothetical protein